MIMPRKAKKPVVVYIYEDLDHSEIEVFYDLPKAKAYAEEHWGEPNEWIQWEQNKDTWFYGEYVRVLKKTIQD
jgi:hypothetical protein